METKQNDQICLLFSTLGVSVCNTLYVTTYTAHVHHHLNCHSHLMTHWPRGNY